LQFGGQNLQQSSAPQTMTLTNTGNAADTIVSITTQTTTAGTHDYTTSSNCGTLAPGANCAIQVTFAPSVAGPDDGTLTVTASQPGTSVNAALFGSGNTLAWMAGQTPVATVPSGQTATYALQLQIVGYTGNVATACAGLPAGASCAWSQPALQAAGSGVSVVTFTVATGPDVAASNSSAHSRKLTLALCLGLCVLPLARRRRLPLLLVLAAIALGVSSCGGNASSNPPQRTPPGTYTFTVTASGGGMTSNLPVQLIVQ
jgi:hypothetical protein